MTSRPATSAPAIIGHTAGRRLSYPDFTSEQTFQLPDRVITRNAITRFGRRYDPQPFHVDDRAARNSILKGLSASGWHTCTVFMAALQEGLLTSCRDTHLFAVDEIKWLFPVRPGDRIKGTVRMRAIDAPGPWPGSGQVELDCAATTDKGRRVMTWKGRLAVAGYDGSREPAETAGSPADDISRRAGVLAHFDDVSVGDEVALGSRHVTADAIRDFIAEYGLDADDSDRVGATTMQASNWHIAAIFMSQLVRYYVREAAGLRRKQLPVPGLGPSPGIRRVRWLAPVRADDVLTFRAWAVRKSAIAPQSNWGLLTGACAAVNQFGQSVLTFEGQLLLERRPPLVVD